MPHTASCKTAVTKMTLLQLGSWAPCKPQNVPVLMLLSQFLFTPNIILFSVIFVLFWMICKEHSVEPLHCEKKDTRLPGSLFREKSWCSVFELSLAQGSWSVSNLLSLLQYPYYYQENQRWCSHEFPKGLLDRWFPRFQRCSELFLEPANFFAIAYFYLP